MNDQNEYLQYWAEQLYQINKKHKDSLVETYRCHRSHRSYPGDTGKSCTAKCFNDSVRTTGVLEDRAIHRKSTNSKNNQTPEKRLIYEVASLLLHNAGTQSRTLKPDSISCLAPKVTMMNKLGRSKFQREMHGEEGDDADCIVTSIRNIYSGFKSRRAIATSGDTNELEKDDA